MASCTDRAGRAPLGRDDAGRHGRERVGVFWVYGDVFGDRDQRRVGAIASQGFDERPHALRSRVQDSILAARVVVAVTERAVLAGVFPGRPRPRVRGAGHAVEVSRWPGARQRRSRPPIRNARARDLMTETNDQQPFEPYEVRCVREAGRWKWESGFGGFSTGTPGDVLAEARRVGWS